MSERDLLLAQALTELGDARRDATRLAEQAQATLDRVIGARYDRPVIAPARPAPPARSPMDAEDPTPASSDSDEVFLRKLGATGEGM